MGRSFGAAPSDSRALCWPPVAKSRRLPGTINDHDCGRLLFIGQTLNRCLGGGEEVVAGQLGGHMCV